MELFLIVLIVFVAFMVPKAVDAHIIRVKLARVAKELKKRLARELKERLRARRRK